MHVRPLKKEEIPLIVSYFFSASPEFLKGMGADPNKLPNKQEWAQSIENEIDLPVEEKKLFHLLWIHNHKPIGHSNLTFLEYGKEPVCISSLESECKEKETGLAIFKPVHPLLF